MEDCTICFTLPKVVKVMDCQHQICHKCYIRLDKSLCPFIRKEFTYTQCELEERIKLNLVYTKWQPPNIINNSIPNNRVVLSQPTNTQTNTNRPQPNIDIPYIRLERSRKRKRRRKRNET